MINFQLSMPKQNSSHRQPGLGKTRAQSGFTVIELLIATAVFSVVLLLVAEGILSFNNVYYKGITQSNTQNAARSVLENISQAIQFSGGAVTSPITANGSSKGFCIGGQRYSYLLGQELVDSGTLGTDQAHHVLVQDSPNGGCGGTNAQDVASLPVNLTANEGVELLSQHMRLAKLTVSQLSGTDLYQVEVRVAYGDNAFLYSPSGNALGPVAPDATCHADWAGAQFCATAELSTVVEQRIAN